MLSRQNVTVKSRTKSPKATVSKSQPTASQTDSDSDKENTSDVPMESDSESEDFYDMMEEDKQEREEMDRLLNQGSYKKGDFILVKFVSKKIVTCYIGKIEQIDEEEGEVQTNFLRRLKLKTEYRPMKFTWPEIKDVSWHEVNDILLKLPNPANVGGTSRTAEKLSFSCDLSQFDAQLQ